MSPAPHLTATTAAAAAAAAAATKTVRRTAPSNHLYQHKYSVSPSFSPRSFICDNQAVQWRGQGDPATLWMLLRLDAPMFSCSPGLVACKCL